MHRPSGGHARCDVCSASPSGFNTTPTCQKSGMIERPPVSAATLHCSPAATTRRPIADIANEALIGGFRCHAHNGWAGRCNELSVRRQSRFRMTHVGLSADNEVSRVRFKKTCLRGWKILIALTFRLFSTESARSWLRIDVR